MQIRVTIYGNKGKGQVMLHSNDRLFMDPPGTATYGTTGYKVAVGRRLTPLGEGQR